MKKFIGLFSVALILGVFVVSQLMSYSAAELLFDFKPITDEVEKVDDLDAIYDTYYSRLQTTESEASEMFVSGQVGTANKPVWSIEGKGNEVIGQWILYKNLNANGQIIDIKLTITDANVYSQNGTESISFGKIFGDTWCPGYDLTEYNVEFFDAGTNNPANISLLTSFGDIDAAQFYGWVEGSGTTYVQNDTKLNYDSMNGFEYLSYGKASSGDPTVLALTSYEKITNFKYQFGEDYGSKGTNVNTNFSPGSGAYTALDFRISYPKSYIEVNKVDEKNNPLSGAVFEITDSESNVVDTITTDDKGSAMTKGLIFADYTITETNAPVGYINSNFTENITLSPNKEVYVVNSGSAIVNEKATTTLSKVIADESGEVDGILEDNETLDYKIVIKPEQNITVIDEEIKDSILTNIPDYATYNKDESVNFYNNSDDTVSSASNSFSGSLATNDFKLDVLDGSSYAVITYSVTFNDVPQDVSTVTNYVTDNGSNPQGCAADDIDCSSAQIALPGFITAEKLVSDENGDSKVQTGELLTYSIVVTNPNNFVVEDIEIKDDLTEVPELDSSTVTNLQVNGESVEGDIKDGITTDVDADSKLTVSFDVTTTTLIEDNTDITNVASVVDPNHKDAVLNPSANIVSDAVALVTSEKTQVDASNNTMAEEEEVITYKITLTNNTSLDALGVTVIDSLEEAPELDSSTVTNLQVNGSDVEGSIVDGILVDVPSNSITEISFDVKVGEKVDSTKIKNVATVIDPNDPDNPQKPSTEIPTHFRDPEAKYTISQTGAKYYISAIAVLVVIVGVLFIIKKIKK